MGRKKLGREPHLIKLLPEAWAKAKRLGVAAETSASEAIERLVLAADEPAVADSSDDKARP